MPGYPNARKYCDYYPEYAYGVTVGQVWGTDPTTGKGANRRGITRAHLAAVIAARDGRSKAS